MRSIAFSWFEESLGQERWQWFLYVAIEIEIEIEIETETETEIRIWLEHETPLFNGARTRPLAPMCAAVFRPRALSPTNGYFITVPRVSVNYSATLRDGDLRARGIHPAARSAGSSAAVQRVSGNTIGLLRATNFLERNPRSVGTRRREPARASERRGGMLFTGHEVAALRRFVASGARSCRIVARFDRDTSPRKRTVRIPRSGGNRFREFASETIGPAVASAARGRVPKERRSVAIVRARVT